MTDARDVAQLFCEYFSKVAVELENQIPVGNICPATYLPPSVQHSFFVTPATAITDIEVAVKSLKSRTGAIGEMPVFVYKMYSSILSPIITELYNESISTGVYPTILKEAKIVPVHKKDKKSNIENYRPMSTTYVYIVKKF